MIEVPAIALSFGRPMSLGVVWLEFEGFRDMSFSIAATFAPEDRGKDKEQYGEFQPANHLKYEGDIHSPCPSIN